MEVLVAFMVLMNSKVRSLLPRYSEKIQKFTPSYCTKNIKELLIHTNAVEEFMVNTLVCLNSQWRILLRVTFLEQLAICRFPDLVSSEAVLLHLVLVHVVA